LLQHWPADSPTRPCLVLGTYRTVDLDRTHPLADVLAELSREHLYQRVLLSAFSREQAEAFIEALNGAAAVPAVADAIYRGTEGNPFFVEEVVRPPAQRGAELDGRARERADWGIPEGLRQVIGKRLSRLSPSANRLLQAAAVLGEGFTFEVLAETSSTGPQEETAALLDALDETLTAGLPSRRGKELPLHPCTGAAGGCCRAQSAEKAASAPAGGAGDRAHLRRNLDSCVAELAYHFWQAGGPPVQRIERCSTRRALATGRVRCSRTKRARVLRDGSRGTRRD